MHEDQTRDPLAHPAGRHVAARRAGRRQGPAHRRAGVRPGVQDLPRSGPAGAPKFGDKAAWAKVIAQGQRSRPSSMRSRASARCRRRAAIPISTNVEVERAVVFMANKAGANWKEPAATTATAQPPAKRHAAGGAAPPAAAPGAAATTAAAAAPAARAPSPTARRSTTRRARCVTAPGVAGAPKFGDKAAWAPRIKTGIDTLYATALKGKGAMPAEGRQHRAVRCRRARPPSTTWSPPR